jgi:hypothetical protein
MDWSKLIIGGICAGLGAGLAASGRLDTEAAAMLVGIAGASHIGAVGGWLGALKGRGARIKGAPKMPDDEARR